METTYSDGWLPVQSRPRRMAAVSRHALKRDSVQDQFTNKRQRFTNTSACFADPFISHQYWSPSDSRAFFTTSVFSSVLQIRVVIWKGREYSIIVYGYMQRTHANAIAQGEHNQTICPSSDLLT
ncbi:hypothetical protein PENFLA_c002G01426 [Penicillium flavigenum]|uniref:Uncharacterized protein n=1 Tax=Penicillium flavigenum TaxID=254877 RepID=A0A1V6TXA5_9EURO|nr:hypothetical protein PENFLA_c002G01426 [Penicillium flavigenum]